MKPALVFRSLPDRRAGAFSSWLRSYLGVPRLEEHGRVLHLGEGDGVAEVVDPGGVHVRAKRRYGDPRDRARQFPSAWIAADSRKRVSLAGQTPSSSATAAGDNHRRAASRGVRPSWFTATASPPLARIVPISSSWILHPRSVMHA